MQLAQRRYSQVDLRLDATERTAEGFLRGVAPITKTGVFPYKNSDGTTRFELRSPKEVFSKASLDSLKMMPIQVEHRAMLDANNMGALKVGHTGEAVEVDGNVARIPIVVDDKKGLDAIAAGKKELSCGYTLDLEPAPPGSTYDGQPYTHVQKNIRYNHLAITDRARLGPDLRLDAADAVEVDAQTTIQQEPTMNLKKIAVDGIEYDAAPEVVNALSKATAATATEKARADKADADLAQARKDASKIEGERDAAKAEAKANKDALDKLEKDIPARAAQMAKDRAEVDRVARDVLTQDAFEKTVGLDAAGLRLEVVKAKHPDLKLDGKDEVYIQAVFDSVASTVKQTGTNAAAENRAASTPRQGNDGAPRTAEQARIDSEKRRQNAYKNPTGTPAK